MYKMNRHRDGFKDILNKLIFTIKQYIEKFKKLDSNKKIVVLLNKALQSAIAISMAKNAIEIKKNLKSLKYWGEKINQEKSRNPEYEPSADNIYYRRQAQAIAQGSAIIVKMIAILASNKFEKKIINSGNDDKGSDEMLITHDSMPWTKKRDSKSMRLKKYLDKTDAKREEQIKSVEKSIIEAEKNIKQLKASGSEKISKKAKEAESKLSKFKNQFKSKVRQGLLIGAAWAPLAAIVASLIILSKNISNSVASEPIPETIPVNRSHTVVQRLPLLNANGVARRGGTEVVYNPSRSINSNHNLATHSRNLESFINRILNLLYKINDRDKVRALDLKEIKSSPTTSPGDHFKRFGSIDLEGENGIPSTSPGEYGERFSGLDLDSKRWITAHDYMPWSRDHRDYGVKGMQKGKHLKAKDDPKQASGVKKNQQLHSHLGQQRLQRF